MAHKTRKPRAPRGGAPRQAARDVAQEVAESRFQDPEEFSWARVGALVLAVFGAFALWFLVNVWVAEFVPRGLGRPLVTVPTIAMAVVGAGVIAAGLTRATRFPGEAAAAGGLVLWCLATLLGDEPRLWLAMPALAVAWASLAVDLAPDTRVALFLVHLLPTDAVLEQVGLEDAFGTASAVLAGLYLLALLLVLPAGGPWRIGVAGFVGAAVLTALLAGLAYGAWTARLVLYFIAVLAYGAAAFLVWRSGRVPLWQAPLLRRFTVPEHPAPGR